MKNKYVDFISDEHFLDCVANLHKAYLKAKNNITKKKFNENKVDIIKLTFDSKFNEIDEESLIKTEILRQIDKSINNSIGTFHEQILGGIKGFEVGNFSGFDIKANDNTLFAELKNKLSCFRDFIAYRIVIAMPRCHLKNGENVREEELRYLYEIANILPGFLEERGFTAEPARGVQESTSPLLSREAKPYYRDYICNNSEDDYQSLHITFYDNSSRSYMEVQLRTKDMDDVAEIGSANHLSYEKKQESERRRRDAIPQGECIYFDEAYERGMKLLNLKLAELDVNMFSAVNNSLINDGCGLYRGRLILPYEHLSRFQNDLID